MSDTGLRGVLANDRFRAIWIGGVASNLGTMVHTVGAGWLMAMIVTSNDMVSYVQAATTLPVMIFSVLAGVLADSYDRRKILLVAQFLMMAAASALAVSVLSGAVTPMVLLVLTFLLGCGTALHTPSWQAMVGDIVARPQIPNAVTLNSMGLNLTRSVGPAIGGFIVALFGAGAAFVFNAVSFVPMILALRRKTETAARPTPEPLPRAMMAGLRYVAMSPEIITVVFRGFLFGLAAIAMLALLPLVARDRLSGGAMTYGLLLGGYGVGALVAGTANARLRARYSSEVIIRFAFAGMAICMVGTALSPWTLLTAAFVIPAGGCWVLALSLFNVTVQLSTPRWVVGRVLSIYQTASFGGMTAGGWLWGDMSELYSTTAALMLAGACAVLGGLVGLMFRMPDLRIANMDPLGKFVEPELHMDITARSGPVRVQVEYHIPPANVPLFQQAIRDRRRIRLRDGAQDWVLLRDLENPEIWKESYAFPTWADYVRCNQRPTQADAVVGARIRDLCIAGMPPVVQRMIERHQLPKAGDSDIKINPEV